MAYPFLLDIPVPGLKRPESLTLMSSGDQQPPPHDTAEAQATLADICKTPQIHAAPRFKEEEPEESAVYLKTSLDGPPTPSDGQLGPTAGPAPKGPSNKLVFRTEKPIFSAASLGREADRTHNPRNASGDDCPAVIDLTGLDSEDESDTSPSPSRLDMSQELEEESGSTSEPGSSLGSSDAPDTGSSTQPSSPLGPLLPDTGRAPRLTQSIELDRERLKPGGSSQAPDQYAPRGTKRPADPEPDNQGTKVDKQPPKKRGRPKKGPPPPTYKATVVELPNDVYTVTGALGIDNQIIERIRKCLNRAENASGTTEAEARAALHLAYKFMSQYNVKQAEVLSYRTPEEQAQTAGRSIVKISGTDEKLITVRNKLWVAVLAHAMSVFFDCEEFYHQEYFRFDWIFYGIAQNAASAAVAFERIYNLIMDWTRYKKGVSATNSYCVGVAGSLYRDACREKDEEFERAKQAGAEALAKREREGKFQRQEEIRRLQQPSVEDEPDSEMHPQGMPVMSSGSSRRHPHIVDLGSTPSDTSSDTASESGDAEMADVNKPIIISDEEDDGNYSDETQHFDNIYDEVSHLAETIYKKEPPPPSPPPRTASHSLQWPTPSTPPREQTPEPELQWKSEMQLTLFRRTATNVAENYIKSKDIKLAKRRKNTAYPKDPKEFRKGQKDSR